VAKTSHGGKRKGAGRPKGKGPHGEATKPIRIPLSMMGDVCRFVQNRGYKVPLYSSRVPAGIPTPLEDHLDDTIDLNELMIKNPDCTYLVRVTGDSMIDAGIREDDVLVVDLGKTPEHRDIVIVSVDGELTVKRLYRQNGDIMLVPENPDYEPRLIKEGEELKVHGVVTFIIHPAS
jgi:DNA polymerase V